VATYYVNHSPSFVRFYEEHIECDFCGQHTRGRVYDGTQCVLCGSCGHTLIEVVIPERYDA
jgi:NAD-dependent dihydropyrimidine dehydrogenase PreA subunit